MHVIRASRKKLFHHKAKGLARAVVDVRLQLEKAFISVRVRMRI